MSRCLYSESVAQTTQASPLGAGKALFYEGKISEQVALPYTQTVYWNSKQLCSCIQQLVRMSCFQISSSECPVHAAFIIAVHSTAHHCRRSAKPDLPNGTSILHFYVHEAIHSAADAVLHHKTSVSHSYWSAILMPHLHKSKFIVSSNRFRGGSLEIKVLFVGAIQLDNTILRPKLMAKDINQIIKLAIQKINLHVIIMSWRLAEKSRLRNVLILSTWFIRWLYSQGCNPNKPLPNPQGELF